MERTNVTHKDGRNYAVWKDGKNVIIIGPPEGLVDELDLPEPFATRLHNILHARGIFSYSNLNSKSIIAALQEALLIDAQRLTESFFKFSQEASHDHS